MINVLVADDELPAVEELAFLLGRDERIGAIHRAISGAEALSALETESVDAVFLDIHMPALSGLDIARAISRSPRPPAVVFVTADEDCALEAFELAAVDYLLKPVRAERLARSVSRISELIKDGSKVPEMITVDQGGTTRMIRRDDVSYVQAQGDYARLHTAEASYLIRVPLSDLEQQWAEAGFIRIHRSYLMSLNHVGHMKLAAARPSVTVAGAELPISRRHLPAVRDKLEATRIRPQG
ncbi:MULTISPECIES: LytTR family DNA-binding domain-containing protein [Arthrobacter]|jgi:DNA-binding LytR/AlgR family response regulator|uniref:DNA-binding LytR/AlgR family response regulator n=1 Tax=Arthrobacter bambusae TaxID=1338426 RepID=A0AAW8DJH9_9MICC|nr:MULTISPECIES: LytTR family DNA-binding domain-containing protein [Arthrobacter]MDP9906351.1 DNA-binding LytR/AlgR family response regulator [Arthrobacter bambusae]MDQ0129066.1 DNA-binding LytR/AlgR family response regulator [Arthrobacter bambusae]MDQ0180588.1 DNA-binding LytR/AlgR family response regulator [Arthrobacter bambusae]MDQ0239910.1 DNA-binding LytR/AlgR family response regulator [Arthrobacter bambusae]